MQNRWKERQQGGATGKKNVQASIRPKAKECQRANPEIILFEDFYANRCYRSNESKIMNTHRGCKFFHERRGAQSST